MQVGVVVGTAAGTRDYVRATDDDTVEIKRGLSAAEQVSAIDRQLRRQHQCHSLDRERPVVDLP